MTSDERKQLFTAAADAVAGRVPLLCCTAASGTDEASELAHAAKLAGADGVMVTPPYVSEVRPQDILHHFQLLNESAELPILIYNSASIGVHLSPEEIAELAKLDNVAGVKQGATDLHSLVRTVAYAGKDISVMCGSDGLILGGLASGLPGCTSTNANFMTSEFVALYNEFQQGENARALGGITAGSRFAIWPASTDSPRWSKPRWKLSACLRGRSGRLSARWGRSQSGYRTHPAADRHHSISIGKRASPKAISCFRRGFLSLVTFFRLRELCGDS